MIVPVHKRHQLLVEIVCAKWHENDACTFVLETQNESFNERDTPVLSDGAESGCDPLAITPILEHAEPELLALVTDDVFRDGTCVVDGAFEEALNGFGRGIVLICCEAHHTSGVVVDDHRCDPQKLCSLRYQAIFVV